MTKTIRKDGKLGIKTDPNDHYEELGKQEGIIRKNDKIGFKTTKEEIFFTISSPDEQQELINKYKEEEKLKMINNQNKLKIEKIIGCQINIDETQISKWLKIDHEQLALLGQLNQAIGNNPLDGDSAYYLITNFKLSNPHIHILCQKLKNNDVSFPEIVSLFKNYDGEKSGKKKDLMDTKTYDLITRLGDNKILLNRLIRFPQIANHFLGFSSFNGYCNDDLFEKKLTVQNLEVPMIEFIVRNVNF